MNPCWTEQLDLVLVPDLAISQATGQGSPFRGHEPNTHIITKRFTWIKLWHAYNKWLRVLYDLR